MSPKSSHVVREGTEHSAVPAGRKPQQHLGVADYTKFKERLSAVLTSRSEGAPKCKIR